MNVKKMTTEHLQEVISNLSLGKDLNDTEKEWKSACEKELMRRWGIKG